MKKEDKYPEPVDRQVFRCRCGSNDHLMVIERDDWTDIDPYPMVIHFQLFQFRSFWQRVKVAIGYIFKREQRYGNWDTINLNEEDLLRLRALVDDTIKANDD